MKFSVFSSSRTTTASIAQSSWLALLLCVIVLIFLHPREGVSHGLLPFSSVQAFVVPQQQQHHHRAATVGTATCPSTTTTTSTSLFMGISRKARRQLEQNDQMSRAERNPSGTGNKFKKALDELQEDEEKQKAGGPPKDDDDDDDDDENVPTMESELIDPEQEAKRQQREEVIQGRMQERPEVSTMYVDEETGFSILQQGRNVLDVIKRKAIELSPLGPPYILAQMFPGVPPEVRAKYRLNWSSVTMPEIVAALKEAASVQKSDGSRGIPIKPSVANSGLDFCLANRDKLGHEFKHSLLKLMMHEAWREDMDATLEYRKLYRSFQTMDNYIAAPFRQCIMNAEVSIGPNFGNLDMKVGGYVGTEPYERAASYIVLKGMQCTWEKKVRDAEKIRKLEGTKERRAVNDAVDVSEKVDRCLLLGIGDPRRYQPGEEIIFEFEDCVRICAMAQQMVKAFVDVPELFDDLPVELRFIERALSIQGGTALRKFMIDDFCPAEGVTPEGLREGVLRLLMQVDTMYLDPYADIRNVLYRLAKAMGQGMDDHDPYKPYLELSSSMRPDSPAYFQTYTFNTQPTSLTRFFDDLIFGNKAKFLNDDSPGRDAFKEIAANVGGVVGDLLEDVRDVDKQRDTSQFGIGESGTYVPPPERSAGRPHETGWLQKMWDLNDPEEEGRNYKLGQMEPGRIIMEDEVE